MRWMTWRVILGCPWWEESEEEIDDRPLTREELQAKTLRTLNKRESRGAASRRKKR